MSTCDEHSYIYLWYLFKQSIFRKRFRGEKLIRPQPLTFLQIFCKFDFKDILDPDDTCQGNPKALIIRLQQSIFNTQVQIYM